MTHIFISYSHIDSDFVRQLAVLLDTKQISYFLDRKNIEWGDSIPHAVEEGLQNASHLIVVISPASLKSSWVPYEIGIARALRLRILPLLTHPSLDLPGFISNLSYKTSLDDLAGYFDDAVRRSSTLEFTLNAGHMDVIAEPRGWAGINFFEPDKDEIPSDQLPYFELLVKNTGMEAVGLKYPAVDFKTIQYLPGNENGYTGISFTLDEEERSVRLRPRGTKKFECTLFGACLVARGFLDDNIERIYIEDDQMFRSEVGMAQLERAAAYCRWFFPEIDLNEVLRSKFGDDSNES